jgi:hypothetical protein
VPEEEPAFVEFEEVLSTHDRGQIAIIKSLLDTEEIPYLAQGEQFNSIQAPVPVRFLVPKEHAVRARELLEDFL